MTAPWAEGCPGIMDLPAGRTGLPQHGLAMGADQPSGDHLFGTIRAGSSQWFTRLRGSNELHADEIEDDREADDEDQEHVTSHRFR